MKAAWSDWLDRFFDLMREDGLSISREEFALKCDGFFSRDISAAKPDGYTPFERRIVRIGADLNLIPPIARIRFIATEIANAWQKQITLDPEAVPVLQRLQCNRRLAVVSNFDHPPHIHALLDQLDLRRFFETVIISGEAGVAKPDPGIFRIALGNTELEPGEVVYVGDTDDDVKGARSAGIRPILIHRDGDTNKSIKMDYKNDYTGMDLETSSYDGVTVISRLDELPAII